MKFYGKNSIFGLTIKLKIGQDHILGIATGTALTLKALPIPQPIGAKMGRCFSNKDDEDLYQNVLEEFKQMSI